MAAAGGDSPHGPVLNSRLVKFSETAAADYGLTFGVLAGYLPQDRDALHTWLQDIARAAPELPLEQWIPAVRALNQLILDDATVRMYVTEMIDQVPPAHKTVKNIPQLLSQLNHIATTAPIWDPVHSKAFPMSALFVYMMYTPAGEAAFRNVEFNNAIRAVLQAWCAYLDSTDSTSVLNTGPTGWLSPSAAKKMKLKEFIIPPNGFQSFNAYFHREINLDYRPLAPGGKSVVVSANDGTLFKIQRGVKLYDQFWLKSQPYSLFDMLDGASRPKTASWSPEDFVSGDVFQSFLSGADYHRWRAPISGRVIEAKVIDGLQFSELHVLGFDDTAGTYSQGFQAAVNTRGLVIIDSEDEKLGKVCVIPIGITEISSISVTVYPGQRVQQGDELGMFSYGGSTLALVFQPGAIRQFTVQNPPHMKNPDSGTPIQVRAKIADANTA